MILGTILDLLYPIACAACGAPSPTHLCNTCRAAISIRPAITCCVRCGKVMMEIESVGNAVAECGPCHTLRPKFDIARSAAEFKGPVRDLIHKFKYNKATWLCRELTDLLEGCVLTHYSKEKIDCLCPVPLSRTKERTRGYNQAGLLADDLSKQLKIPVLSDILVRTRNTPTQTRMNATERRANVRGAFESRSALRPWTYGRCILLVDDVMTTGSTLSECAAALKANGAERVLALTVARD